MRTIPEIIHKAFSFRLAFLALKFYPFQVSISLVLHGGSGIHQKNVWIAIQHGMAKINVTTEIRQSYETVIPEGGNISRSKSTQYSRTRWVLEEWLGLAGIQKGVLER
jgi:fructose/tagatose bisphosphate aldolase